MSAASKLPQSRSSRIASPSKLPSRILRPTFTNKPSSHSSSFVNSAKLIEQKRETAKSLQQSEVESSSLSWSSANRSDDIEAVLHCNDNFTPDYNGNKRDHSHRKYLTIQNNMTDNNDPVPAISPNKQDNTPIKSNLTTSAKYYEIHKANTVNSPKESDNRTYLQTDEASSNVQYSKKNNDASNTVSRLRSIKPGNFQQKVTALKTTQQKVSGFTERPTSLPSRISVCSKSTGRSKFGYKSDENTADDNDGLLTSLTQKDPALSGTSRLGQNKSGLSETGSAAQALMRYSSRAEKRKKYLELKNKPQNLGSVSSISSCENNIQSMPFSFQKRFPSNDDLSDERKADTQSKKREYLRKPALRSAKIARPVVRPKKLPSPITAKPFVSVENTLTDQATKTVKTRPPSYIDANIINDFLNEDHSGIITSRLDDNRLAEKCTDENLVESVASEESGYSSVASNLYLDIRNTGTEDSCSALSQNPNIQLNEHPYFNELEENTSDHKQHNIANGQSSNSLSDVLSTVLDHDDEKESDHIRYCSYIASKDITSFGQYRSQAEGNYSPEEKYGISEARQIRTSSDSESDIIALREIQVSPDFENASNSSAETVIPNTRSPQPLDSNDLSDNQKEACDNVNTRTDFNTQEVTSSDKIRSNKSDAKVADQGGSSDFHFFPATSMRTPEPHGKLPHTPSTNSTSKAKKRKTDLLIMSPLIIDEKVENEQDEETGISVENGNASTDEIDVRDESLSEFFDLPSLHESALMIDCNSILEDDDDESCSLEDDKVFNSDAEGNSRSTSTAQTNVINKLLSQGLNGIVGAGKTSSSPKPFINGYHTEHSKTTDSLPLKSRVSTGDIHRTDKELYNDSRLEIVAMKKSLLQLYQILEKEEAQKEKQIEENKHLQLKIQKLTQMNKNLTKELSVLKMKTPPIVCSKDTQVEVEYKDASTNTESTKNEAQSTSLRWFHTEVSDKLESNIKETSEVIQYLKDLRADFDRRIQDTEERLSSALQLLHR